MWATVAVNSRAIAEPGPAGLAGADDYCPRTYRTVVGCSLCVCIVHEDLLARPVLLAQHHVQCPLPLPDRNRWSISPERVAHFIWNSHPCPDGPVAASFPSVASFPFIGSCGEGVAHPRYFFAIIRGEFTQRERVRNQAEARVAILDLAKGWGNSHRHLRRSAAGQTSPSSTTSESL